jgi:IS1 family transposase
MNKLPVAKRIQILSMLCEGSSMRSISHVADVSINTASKLLINAGLVCIDLHDELVRNVKASRVQCDEIWSFVYAKEKNVATAKAAPDAAGDVWTWTALNADSKLIVSYFVGDRSGQSAIALMDDLRSRLSNRVQLTTDGHRAYLDAVEGAFGGDVDYAQLVKLYGAVPESAKGRYSPAECIGARKEPVEGNPDPKHISRSYVERQNLNMRMGMRRFTRLTNGFSKKVENLAAAVSLHFAYYNFCRVHASLHKQTPAMAAGITDHVWTLAELIALLEQAEAVPVKRGSYAKTRAVKRAAEISD